MAYEKDGSAENPPKNELDFLFQFLQQEVEKEEQRQLVKIAFSSKEIAKDSTPTNKKFEAKKGKSSATAAGLFNGQTKSVSCIFCEKSHDSKDCGRTEFWSLEELKKKFKKRKSVFIA